MVAVKMFVGFYGLAVVGAVVAWMTNGQDKYGRKVDAVDQGAD